MNSTKEINIEDILHKQYWSFNEIIDLSVSKSEIANSSSDAIDHQDDSQQNIRIFKADLFENIVTAINDSNIVRINMVKRVSWNERYGHYIEQMKIPGLLVLLAVIIYVLKRLALRPDVKAALAEGGGHGDLNRLFVDVFEYFMAYPAALVFLACVFGAIRMIYLKAQCNHPDKKLKYYECYASDHGYLDSLYERESVIRFLNSKYSFDLEVKNRTKSDVSSENAKADRINKKVQSVADYFIDQELAKGCTCLHSDLSRYIAPLALKASLSKIKESRSYARRTDDDLLNDSELKTKVDGWCEEATTSFFKTSEKYPDAKTRIKGSWEVYRQPPPCKVHGK